MKTRELMRCVKPQVVNCGGSFSRRVGESGILKTILLVMALAAFAPTSQATTVTIADYNLTGGSCCGNGPFGTVELSQDTSITTTQVKVTVAMNSGIGIIETGSHIAFGFGITGDPAINISGITNSAFVGVTSIVSSSSQGGTWDYSLDCTGCGNGSNNSQSGVMFNVSLVSNGVLTVGDFTGLFTADIVNFNVTGNPTGPIFSGPCTGDCGSVPPQSLTPEPISLGLTGTGLIGIYFLGRRRQMKRG